MGEGDNPPWANLGFREEAAVFESASQNARVLTEGWVEAASFCPNCGAQPISRFAVNRPVATSSATPAARRTSRRARSGPSGPRRQRGVGHNDGAAAGGEQPEPVADGLGSQALRVRDMTPPSS